MSSFHFSFSLFGRHLQSQLLLPPSGETMIKSFFAKGGTILSLPPGGRGTAIAVEGERETNAKHSFCGELYSKMPRALSLFACKYSSIPEEG